MFPVNLFCQNGFMDLLLTDSSLKFQNLFVFIDFEANTIRKHWNFAKFRPVFIDIVIVWAPQSYNHTGASVFSWFFLFSRVAHGFLLGLYFGNILWLQFIWKLVCGILWGSGKLYSIHNSFKNTQKVQFYLLSL